MVNSSQRTPVKKKKIRKICSTIEKEVIETNMVVSLRWKCSYIIKISTLCI
jgi:hypothetical protein